MALKVYVLIATEPGTTKRVVAALGQIPTMREAHEVLGPYDIVLELEPSGLSDIPSLINQLRQVPGVHSTTSLVSFPDR